MVELFVKEIIHLYGVLHSIVSHWDSWFLSSFWQELFCLQGTSLKMSSAYHLETDGQTKVLNMGL